MQEAKFTTRRLVLDALLIALYVVFSTVFTIKTPIIEISLASMTILLSAKLFGLADALAVATLGSFIEQLLSPYGLSYSTLIFMAPFIVMAAFASLGFRVAKGKNGFAFFAVIIVSELLLTVLNTAALYLDGYLMHYAVKALHLIAIPRLINSAGRIVISSVIMSMLVPVLSPLLRKKED